MVSKGLEVGVELETLEAQQRRWCSCQFHLSFHLTEQQALQPSLHFQLELAQYSYNWCERRETRHAYQDQQPWHQQVYLG